MPGGRPRTRFRLIGITWLELEAFGRSRSREIFPFVGAGHGAFFARRLWIAGLPCIEYDENI